MSSKEEIEEAKGWLSALEVNSEFEASLKECLLSYIEELEFQNNALKTEHKYNINRIKQVERKNRELEIGLNGGLDMNKKTCFYEDGHTGKCLGYSFFNNDEPCIYCKSCEALSTQGDD